MRMMESRILPWALACKGRTHHISTTLCPSSVIWCRLRLSRQRPRCPCPTSPWIGAPSPKLLPTFTGSSGFPSTAQTFIIVSQTLHHRARIPPRTTKCQSLKLNQAKEWVRTGRSSTSTIYVRKKDPQMTVAPRKPFDAAPATRNLIINVTWSGTRSVAINSI